jgi:hypothetical protein
VGLRDSLDSFGESVHSFLEENVDHFAATYRHLTAMSLLKILISCGSIYASSSSVEQ